MAALPCWVSAAGQVEGSYRTLQRFFMTPINWGQLNWQLIKSFALKDSNVILIAGDATTVTKSGKKTFGLGRFFSSIYARAVPGISFQVLSLIDVERSCSWPFLVEQVMPKCRSSKSKNTAKRAVKQPGRSPGRPKGSKNKNRRDVKLNAEMTQVQAMLRQLLAWVGETVKPIYFVYDEAFGNHAAVQMTRQTGLHLLSKLCNHSALYCQWQGVYGVKGARRRYGERVDYAQLPRDSLISDRTEKGVRTLTYHFTALHKTFADALNVVVILKYNEQTKKTALTGDCLVNDYRLRFQIMI